MTMLMMMMWKLSMGLQARGSHGVIYTVMQQTLSTRTLTAGMQA